MLLNALAIAISTDNHPDNLVWKVLEILYLAVFMVEFVIKLCIFGLALTFCGPGRWWNAFDMFCILTGLIDAVYTFILGLATAQGLMMIKLLRLARLSRLVRLLRYEIFKKLKLMVGGVIAGVRVLHWAIFLLFGVILGLGILT